VRKIQCPIPIPMFTTAWLIFCTMYRVALNKPDYSQLLYFYNKTRKYDNVHVAPKTLVTAMLSVS